MKGGILEGASPLRQPSIHDSEFSKDMDDIHDETIRREFRWSKAARDLVHANMDATGSDLTALLTKLEEESGNPRWACRRFARQMGIKSKRPYRMWTVPEQERLVKLIDLQPINEIAKIMRRSQSSIWHMLYRLGANAKMGNDSFTKYTLAMALHVHPATIESWIARGWLKAKEIETTRGNRLIIAAEEFCEFCRQHTRDVVGNRLTRERLDFVYHFAFPPSHTELLPVRSAHKEERAYEAQMREEIEDSTEFGLTNGGDDDDVLGRIA